MTEIVDTILEKYPAHKKDKLLPILQEIQESCGYLTDEILNRVGEHVDLPSNKVYGVAAFYDQFRFKRTGKNHIRICNGTACYLFGSGTFLQELEKQLRIKPGQTTRDGKFSLEVVHCMGSCESAPVMKINDVVYPHLTPEELQKIFRTLKEKNQ
jgi:NADH-quinone oxidoreductase subunit E